MLGWDKRETMRASSMNMVTNSPLDANSSRIILMATSSVVCSVPATRAAKTEAIPPSAIFAISS